MLVSGMQCNALENNNRNDDTETGREFYFLLIS